MRRMAALAVALLLVLVLTGGTTLLAQEPAPNSPDTLDAFALPASPDAPLGTAFTYQGLLESGGVPANGAFDFQFSLFNALTGGIQRGATLTRNDVPVTRGIFNVLLDYADIYTNELLWIQVAVRPGSSTGLFTTLTPRQPLTPSPYTRYAARAAAAGTAVNASTLQLPWSATGSSSDNLISLANTGLGGAARFDANSAFSTMSLVNGGTGGGLFVQTAPAAIDHAVASFHYGGEGFGGYFDLSNITNSRSGLFARTNGSGFAAQFEVNHSTSPATALFVRTTSGHVSSNAATFVGDVFIQSSGNPNNPGDLSVAGTLSKGAGAFRIDHPLDPENKYLQHSFVESPDMMNIYNGNATLDGAGEATVALPDWFEALNKDFRYQLTPIGAPGPNLYIAQEVQNNSFRIAGGAPGQQVSWQVTGIRHDAFAEANRIQVEVPKTGEEAGTYLHPAAFGLSVARGVAAARLPTVPPAAPPTDAGGQ